MRSRSAGIAALLVAAVSLSACSTVEQAANDAAGAAGCVVVEGLAAQVGQIADSALSGASVAELKAQADSLRITVEGLGAALGTLAPEVSGSLQQAGEVFESAVAQIPTDAASAAAEQAYAEAATTFQAAIDQAVTPLNC